MIYKVWIFFIILHFEVVLPCPLGCSSCQNSSCDQCENGFTLIDGGCAYQKCSRNSFLYKDDSNSQMKCLAICEGAYQEDWKHNTCTRLEKCPVTYLQSQNSSSNASVGSVVSIIEVNSSILLVVFPTYLNVISSSGSFLRRINSDIVKIIVLNNILLTLNSQNQVQQWRFETDETVLLSSVSQGTLSNKSTVVSTDNTLSMYIVTSFNEDSSIAYFTCFNLSGDSINQVFQNKFIYSGCSFNTIEKGILICVGSNNQLKISQLKVSSSGLEITSIPQSQSCTSLSFSSSSILSNIHLVSKQLIYILQQNINVILSIDYSSGSAQCNLNSISSHAISLKYYNNFIWVLFSSGPPVAYKVDNFTSPQISLTDLASDLLLKENYLITLSSANQMMSIYTINYSNLAFTKQTTLSTQGSSPTSLISISSLLPKSSFDSFVFAVGDSVQSIDLQTQQTKFVLSSFQSKSVGHTNFITQLYYSAASLYLFSCSTDGSLIAWDTTESTSPVLIFTINLNQGNCLNVLVHNDQWVVALFQYSIVIFDMFVENNMKTFQFASSSISWLISDNSQVIVLYYDYMFHVLDGISLNLLSTLDITVSNYIITQIMVTESFSIIANINQTMLQIFQIDISSYQITQSQTSIFSQSSCPQFSFFDIDQSTNKSGKDLEIWLGCKSSYFLILNNDLQSLISHKLTTSYPIQVSKSQSGSYILYIFSTDATLVYRYFHYSYNRAQNTGIVFNKSYSLKFLVDLVEVTNYLSQTDAVYTAIMPFSYFNLLLRGIFHESNLLSSYGFFVFFEGQPISAKATKDNGKVQYFGSQNGTICSNLNDYYGIKTYHDNLDYQKDPIMSVQVSAVLSYVFIVKSKIEVYNLFTNQLSKTISFNSTYMNESVNRLLIVEELSIAISYKSKQLLIYNFDTDNIFSNQQIKNISGILIDKKLKTVYSYGSSLQSFDIDLSNNVIISNEQDNSFQYCDQTSAYLVCKVNSNSVYTYKKKTYEIVSQINIKNQNTFKLFTDSIYERIFAYSQLFEVFDIKGVQLAKISTITFTITEIRIYGKYLVFLTNAYLYVFWRSDMTLIKQLKPSGGGNILGCYWIQSYNLLAYYADEVRYGQIFYFNLITQMEEGSTISSYTEMGIGQVVSLSFDDQAQRLNYLDSYGNFNSVNFKGQISFKNVIAIEEFNVIGQPVDMIFELNYSSFYVYNKRKVFRINYNLAIKQASVLYDNHKRDLSFSISTDSSTSSNSYPYQAYYVIDSSNRLFSYWDLQMNYVGYLEENVIQVIKSIQYNKIIFVFQNRLQIYPYQTLITQQINKQNSSIMQIVSIRYFLTNEIAVNQMNQIVQFDFNQGIITNTIEISPYRQIRHFIIKDQLILFTFKSGAFISYDTQTKAIQTIFQSGASNCYAKYITYSKDYYILGYMNATLLFISQSDFSNKTLIDLNPIISPLGINQEINLLYSDFEQNKIFVDFVNYKVTFVISTTSFQIVGYLAFSNINHNQMKISGDNIFLYCESQVNIYNRSSLKLKNTIRKNNYFDTILELIIVDFQNLIIAYNNQFEIYLLNLSDYTLILVTSMPATNPHIIETFIFDSILYVIGVQKTTVFENRINLSLYSSSSTLATSTLCYQELDMRNRIIGQNMFEDIYKSDSQIANYRMSSLVGDQFMKIDFIPSDSVTVIIEPQSSSNNYEQLKLKGNSFQMLSRKTIYLKDFSFVFLDSNSVYNFSYSTTSVVIQNIEIANQVLERVSILFSTMTNVTIHQISLKNITLSSSNNDITQTLFNFTNCQNIFIHSLSMDNVIFSKNYLLLQVQQSDQIEMINLSITKSIFYQMIYLEKITKVLISNLNAQNNYNMNRFTYQNSQASELFLLSIVGCLQTNLNQFQISNNSDVLLFYYANYYQNTYQKVILYTDQLFLTNIVISNNMLSQDNLSLFYQRLQALFLIQSTSVVFSDLNYNYNQGNLKISNSGSIQIINSLLFNNIALDGGVFYMNEITGQVTVSNSTFHDNRAKGSGGAFYLVDITSFEVKDGSSISHNSALIGGGLRVINTDQFPSGVVIGENFIINNQAAIWGDEIGTYPTKFQLFLNETKIEMQSNRILDATTQQAIFLNQFKSGNYLPLQVQFLDQANKIVTFSSEKFKKEEYPASVLADIKSLSVQIYTKDQNKIITQGQFDLTYQQFSDLYQKFEFTTLKVLSIPHTQQQLILTFTTNPYYSDNNQITLNISLRPCIAGEVIRTISNEIVICETCSEGLYSIVDPNTESFVSCQQCPESGQSCSGNQIILKQGYWRKSKDTDIIIPCPQSDSADTSCKESEPESQNGCIRGYVGALCQQCDLEAKVWDMQFTSKSQLNTQTQNYCYECEVSAVTYLYLIIPSIFLLIYLIISIKDFMASIKYHIRSTYIRLMKVIPISNSCMQNASMFYARALLNYLQLSSILLLFPGIENALPVVKNIISFINYFGSPQSTITTESQCIFPKSYLQEYGTVFVQYGFLTLYPSLLIVIVFLIFLLCGKFHFFGISKYYSYGSLIFLINFFQPDLVRSLTKALSCIEVGSEWFIFADLTRFCSNSSYKLFLYSFVTPVLIIILSTPTIGFLLLRRYKNNLDDAITKLKYGYFYLEFKKKQYYWEFLRNFFKMLLVLIYTLLNQTSTILAFYFSSLLLGLYILSNLVLQPFLHIRSLKLEISSLAVLQLNILLCLLYTIYSDLHYLQIMYLIHFGFIFIVIILILLLKLNSAESVLFKTILIYLKRIIPHPIYSKLFPRPSNQMQTFQRWIKIRDKYVKNSPHYIIRSKMNSLQRPSPEEQNLLFPTLDSQLQKSKLISYLEPPHKSKFQKMDEFSPCSSQASNRLVEELGKNQSQTNNLFNQDDRDYKNSERNSIQKMINSDHNIDEQSQYDEIITKFSIPSPSGTIPTIFSLKKMSQNFKIEN